MIGTAVAATVQSLGVRLIVPVKSLGLAKSRLDLPAAHRRAVAVALVVRTFQVAAGCAPADHITVVTPDPDVADLAREHAMMVVEDRGGGLNQAVTVGLTRSRRLAPEAVQVVLVSDLPVVQVPELTMVLAAVARSSTPRHVPDRCGHGTTVLAIPPGVEIPILFGPDSARRFTEAGSVPLLDAPPGMRADLDTVADLEHLSIQGFECINVGLDRSTHPVLPHEGVSP